MKDKEEIQRKQETLLRLANKKGVCVESQVLMEKAGVLAWVLKD